MKIRMALDLASVGLSDQAKIWVANMDPLQKKKEHTAFSSRHVHSHPHVFVHVLGHASTLRQFDKNACFWSCKPSR